MSGIPQYTPDENLSDEARIQGLIEFLSAYIEQYHGGWVKLVSFNGETLVVELGGACEGCSLSTHTLHGWVEGTVRQFFPDIKEIRDIASPAR